MKKRFLSVVLVFAMLTAFAPIVTFAATSYSGTCGVDGDNLTWELKYGVLTISGTGDMKNYGCTAYTQAPWFGSLHDSIKSVVIEDGVTSIGAWAFHYCTNLACVEIPDSVTSIGEAAFYQCFSLVDVKIPSAITSISKISFCHCTSLTTIEIPISVTSIGERAFKDCSVITDVYYGGTEDEWNEISINSTGNDNLTSATIHYNSIGEDDDDSDTDGNASDDSDTGTIGTVTVNTNDAELVLSESQLESFAMLENITLGDDTLYGPSVTILGKTFYLFELDGKLTFSLGDLDVEFKVDTSDKTIKALIGFNGLSKSGSTGTDYSSQGEWTKSYTQMKSLYKVLNGKDVTDYKSAMKKFDSLYDELKEGEQNLFLNIKGTMAGYLEWSYESSTPSLSEGGIVIKVSASGSFDSRIAAFPAAYVTVGLSVSADGSIAIAFNGASNPLSISSKLNIAPAINIGIDLGSKKTKTYIEGGLKGTMGVDVIAVTGKFAESLVDFDPLVITLTASVYVKGQLWVLSAEHTETLASKQIFPTGSTSATALSLMSVDEDDWELMPRDYLNNDGISLLSLNDEASFEKSSLYPYSEPTLVLLDSGERLLIWIDDNSEKADADRTSLYYSIESGGAWSEPQTVYDNDGYNGSPVVYSDGGNVYVLWQRAGESLGDSAELEDMAAVMDLYMTVFDGESFCEPMCVSDSANAEMIYDISAAGDGVAAVWVENSGNDPFMSEGTNTIYRREYTGGAWNDAETVLQTDSVIDDTIIYGDSVIWASSTDEVGVIYIDDTQIAQTSGETNMQLVGDDLYYISDGVMYCYDLTAGTTAETGIGDITNFEIIENGGQMTIFTLVSTGFTCELYENIYDGETWGEWSQLTNDDKYIRNYSPVIASDGSLSIVLNSVDVDEDNESVYSTATLTVLDDCTYSDIEVDETMYCADEVAAGETVNLCFDVFNNSRTEIAGVKTVLTDASGNVLQTAYVDADLAAGEEKTLSVPYIIPDDMTLSALTVTVSADMDEADDSNNTASCTIGYADLEITDLEISAGNGSAKIIGTLANTGFTDVSDAEVEVYNSNISDELLTTLDIGELAAGESVEIEYELPESYLSLDDEDILYGIFFTALTADMEEDYENNDEKIVFGDLSEAVSATTEPTAEPTETPTAEPTETPTAEPTVEATDEPTLEPTAEPATKTTIEPTAEPTDEPTATPVILPVPDGITVESVTLDSITVSWAAVNDDGVMGYVVSIYSGNTLVKTEFTDDTFCTIDGLESETEYAIKLQSTNGENYSDVISIDITTDTAGGSSGTSSTEEPTAEPTNEPTEIPTVEPTTEPTIEPTEIPTTEPTIEPTATPTPEVTTEPTANPTKNPTINPTDEPTIEPTTEPTVEPTDEPTLEPTAAPVILPVPDGLTVESVTSDSITISWTAVNNDSVTGYVVSVYSGGKLVRTELTDDTSCTISGLESETEYTIKLQSTDSENYSDTVLIDITTDTAGASCTAEPTIEPTELPTVEPTVAPTATAEITIVPTIEPTTKPVEEAMETPTTLPSTEPTPEPTTVPTIEPAAEPTAKPATESTPEPTEQPDYAYTINDVTLSSDNVSVSVTDNFGNGVGVLIIAVYDSNGHLTAVKFVNMSEIENGIVSIDINTASAEYVSTFVWDDISKMLPLSEKFTI